MVSTLGGASRHDRDVNMMSGRLGYAMSMNMDMSVKVHSLILA